APTGRSSSGISRYAVQLKSVPTVSSSRPGGGSSRYMNWSGPLGTNRARSSPPTVSRFMRGAFRSTATTSATKVGIAAGSVVSADSSAISASADRVAGPPQEPQEVGGAEQGGPQPGGDLAGGDQRPPDGVGDADQGGTEKSRDRQHPTVVTADESAGGEGSDEAHEPEHADRRDGGG